MKPKLLLANDFHIDKDSVQDFILNWHEMLDVASSHEIKDIWIGGDIFTNRNVQTLATCLAVKHCLNEAASLGYHIAIAPGNHDKVNPDLAESWCDLFADCRGVDIVRNYEIYDMGGCVIVMFAYYPENGEHFRKLIDECSKLRVSGKLIAYVHAGIHGALGNLDIPSEAPQELFQCFDKVLCGHYHNRTQIEGTSIYYVGSSRPHNFGEDEDKGYTIVYDDGSHRHVNNQVNTRFVTDELTFSQVADWHNAYDAKYKVRLKISCTSAEAETIDKQELFDRGASKIEFVTERVKTDIQPTDIESKFSNFDLRKEYLEWCQEHNVDSNFGIDYLDKTN